jgi:hypothetical protein
MLLSSSMMKADCQGTACSRPTDYFWIQEVEVGRSDLLNRLPLEGHEMSFLLLALPRRIRGRLCTT